MLPHSIVVNDTWYSSRREATRQNNHDHAIRFAVDNRLDHGKSFDKETGKLTIFAIELNVDKNNIEAARKRCIARKKKIEEDNEIYVDNVHYTCVMEACKSLGLHYGSIRLLVNEGRTEYREKGTKTIYKLRYKGMKGDVNSKTLPIIINGKYYPTISIAEKDPDLPLTYHDIRYHAIVKPKIGSFTCKGRTYTFTYPANE